MSRSTEKSNPVDVARKVLEEYFPDAIVGFVGGSFNRGEETAYSDIDLVVIFNKVDFAWRESFVFEQWPIEVFAHDPETLHYFFREIDAKSGIPSLASMVSEGPAIGEDQALAGALENLANHFLQGQPVIWSKETIDQQRYAITDLLDDLREPRNTFEAHITIGALHEVLGNFYFRSQCLWSASRKHIPRRLLKIDPVFYSEWVSSFEDAYAGQYDHLLLTAERILAPHGGFLFADYRIDAPVSWRLSLE
ncbi:MAG: nucleotidyltransferase domain-containing protein [Pseudomonadota bacterium]